MGPNSLGHSISKGNKSKEGFITVPAWNRERYVDLGRNGSFTLNHDSGTYPWVHWLKQVALRTSVPLSVKNA